jgi:hypothetical protein
VEEDVPRVTAVRPGLHERQRVRMRRYLTLMGACIVLVVLAWTVVRLFWVELAIAMSVVAAVIPPVAAFVANRDSGD